MIRKAFKLSALSLVLSSVLSATAFAEEFDYKGMQVKEPALPLTSVFIGYSYTHPFYNSTWQNSYRTMTGSVPFNNYNGIDIGMDRMLTNWLALHLEYTYYFERSSGGNDGRLSDLTLGGLMYFNLVQRLYLLGMIGATVDAFVHKGNDTVGTGTNDAFTQTDVNLALGAGIQYQLSDTFYIRPMVNLVPFQNRADSDVRLGFSIDVVYALN